MEGTNYFVTHNHFVIISEIQLQGITSANTFMKVVTFFIKKILYKTYWFMKNTCLLTYVFFSWVNYLNRLKHLLNGMHVDIIHRSKFTWSQFMNKPREEI